MPRPKCPECKRLMSTGVPNQSYICEKDGIEIVFNKHGVANKHYWKPKEVKEHGEVG